MKDIVFFYPEGHAGHFHPGHPERPERVEAIRTALLEGGIWDSFPLVNSEKLSLEVLQEVHQPSYLSLLERACARGGYLDQDTYVTQSSWDLALSAAGGAAAVAEAVWRGEARRGLALCRPPGHHAMKGQGMGFCLLNNIALAAEHLHQRAGAARLAIVDIDLHHGNGTQDIFWRRDDVFFISTHQSPLYPGTGSLEERGAGPGINHTLNIPMPPRSGDSAFLTAFDELILPVLARFEPQMVLVSYGFDAHWSDPLGSLQLSAFGYFEIIQKLTAFAHLYCDERIALFLEGGYDLDAAQACTMGVTSALLDIPFTDPLGISPYAETSAWKRIIAEGKHFWGV